jgi:hypothetical protein
LSGIHNLLFYILWFAKKDHTLSCMLIIDGYPTPCPQSLRPRSLCPRHFVPRSLCTTVTLYPGHFVSGHFVPWSFCPSITLSPVILSPVSLSPIFFSSMKEKFNFCKKTTAFFANIFCKHFLLLLSFITLFFSFSLFLFLPGATKSSPVLGKPSHFSFFFLFSVPFLKKVRPDQISFRFLFHIFVVVLVWLGPS